ncbi:MAG TPA: aspartate--tRNA(Asn) ligase [Actinocrinis sp.]|nr:aspartate--tRNA(Asn) ligase [Actinocrinis sp.]
MPRTLVRELAERVDETVTVYGWIAALRLQSRMQFVVVRDHTGQVQITHRRGESGDPIEAALGALTLESAVKITGTACANPVVKLGGMEIRPSQVEIVSLAQAGLPVDEHTSLDRRLDWRFLDLRRPAQHLVFEVQTTAEQAMRSVAYGEGFTELHTPKLMGTASESGAEVFSVGYFDRTAYLAQSPQFYKQMAICGGIDRVFEIGPVFRAEPSFTSRHATEFTGVDVEMAWIDGVDDVMAFEERMLREVLVQVSTTHGEQIAQLCGATVTVPSVPFPRITHADALGLLRSKHGWDPEGTKDDLDPEGERLLSGLVQAEHGHEFVFVTDYPVSVRPFYHLRHEHDPALTASFDLLWRGIEITTGAQREHRYERLLAQAAEKGMETAPMASYLDCFKFGAPTHGGFGLGLNRLLMVLLGQSTIRESTFLFRGPNRLTP